METGGQNMGEALLIVPPFHGLERPALGVHLLQAVAERAGFSVRVLYANFLLAKRIGEVAYEKLCFMPHGGGARTTWERLFVPAVFGAGSGQEEAPLDLPPEIEEAPLRKQLAEWLDEVTSVVAARNIPIVGSTSTFASLSSIALLGAIKKAAPDTVTILGGANCEGEMAEGMQLFADRVDYIFSGESEQTFLAFLEQMKDGTPPKDRVQHGRPCENMEDLPPPNYSEYYEQFTDCFPDSELIKRRMLVIPYESSRGCWWGEKHHCTFCGLNGNGMKHRKKSPDKVLADLRLLLDNDFTKKVQMADNIMPWDYFSTLLPQLAEANLGADIFYEQKANLSLHHLTLLKKAGVNHIQPGLESLSKTLLKMMNKGVTPRQNIAMLRYGLAESVRVEWNVLVGFPGDSAADYEEMIRLMPLLRHLNPPAGYSVVTFDRFSPYFTWPARYGIENLRPNFIYENVYPNGFPVEKVASHFTGDYDSVLTNAPDTCKALMQEVKEWMLAWRDQDIAPMLSVTELGEGMYLLLDTRGIPGLPQTQMIDEAKAAVALAEPRGGSTEVEWGLANKVCVEYDGSILPLATSSPRLIQYFEEKRKAAVPVN